jgi:putative tricarboxylic transport membrane protein
MRLAWQVAGLALLALAGLVGWEGVGLRYWTSLGPGAGFFPVWLAGLLAALALGMVAQARFGRPVAAAAQDRLSRAGAMRVAGVVGALVAVAALLEPLGFRLTMTGFLFGLLLLLGRQRLGLAAAVALLGGFGGHAVFAGLLGVPLPIGWLGI